MSLSLPAPAKLNLFLHITGRRPDGYHDLQTIFQFVDYGDQLQFVLDDNGLVTVNTSLSDLPMEQDLVYKAAMLLKSRYDVRQGAVINCDKQLPVGAGLGGGSSNAATTMHALNLLWQLDLDLDALAELGGQLGADVPVFVRGFAAFAQGTGERLEKVVLPEPWYIVVRPPVEVSTAEIFNDQELTRDCSPITIRDFLAGQGRNVCEPVAIRRYPSVGIALEWLRAEHSRLVLNENRARNRARNRAISPAMTGTGSCVFCAVDTQDQASALLENLPDPYTGFVAKGCNRSPLLDALVKAQEQASTA